LGCINRECYDCHFADGKLPERGEPNTCPRCGGRMSLEFDEDPYDHVENDEPLEDEG